MRMTFFTKVVCADCRAPKFCFCADLCTLTAHVHAGFKAPAQGQEKTKSTSFHSADISIQSNSQYRGTFSLVCLLPGNKTRDPLIK